MIEGIAIGVVVGIGIGIGIQILSTRLAASSVLAVRDTVSGVDKPVEPPVVHSDEELWQFENKEEEANFVESLLNPDEYDRDVR